MGLVVSGRKFIFLVGFMLLTGLISLTSGEVCSSFITCAGCIGNQFACGWCPAEQHAGPRCVSEKVHNKNGTWCTDQVENPKTFKRTNISKDFKNIRNGDNETIQFKPQHMNVEVRAGELVHFNISYKPAEDYPIDVYYLIDNSFTMKPHKDELAKQAQNIYDSLVSLTNNVRFGMGSFVDKRSMPSSNPYDANPAYSFKNHISLTDDITKFGERVKGELPVGNYDDLEGGLDALMQVMVCFNEIKWRNGSRRMIILSTDASYHSAGDGKIVGAYKHNPMKCHLDADGSYNLKSSLLYDYPSVSQINKVAKDSQTVIIFAVLKEVKEVYEAIADRITGAKYVELSPNSSIVDLIQNEYKKLTQNLKISIETSLPPHIKLSLDPPCSEKNPCSIKYREPRNISVILNVTQCSTNNHYTLKLGPMDLSERLVIDLDVLCNCNCEKDKLSKSPKCKGFGEYKCGICNCDKGRFGAECECEGDLSPEPAMVSCKSDKNDVHECSGRGYCKCGKCICEDGSFGPLCQFRDFSCELYEGQPCAGHGRCVGHRNCSCNAGWSGSVCSCTLDTKSCFVPRSNKVCSGNGLCECGQCICTKVDSKGNEYTGAYCEHCEGCAEASCAELGEFVECYYNATVKNVTHIEACKDKIKKPDNYNITVLNRDQINKEEWRDAHRCKRVLLDGGFIVFKYLDNEDNSTTLLVQREKEEPTKANFFVTVGISIGTILLIGLLTVVAWKVLVDIYDTREYNKFAKQAAADGFIVSKNPLYQSPTVKFENPTYDSNKTDK